MYRVMSVNNGTCVMPHPGAHPEFFIGGMGGGADPEATYILCLILKMML
jgi:hypothetical protein